MRYSDISNFVLESLKPRHCMLYVNEPPHSLCDKDHQKYFFGKERGGVAVDEEERVWQMYSVRLRAVP